MEQAFLRLVADHISTHYKDNIADLCIVLPGKRGALFLKKHLATAFQTTTWLPAMKSAEELITELSGLQALDETELVCHLYESYLACQKDHAEPFESFAKWGQLILHDFNEIDRYLADPAKVYENLRDIKEIENWSLGQSELSTQQERYLAFMNSLGAIYRHFKESLIRNGKGWPGLLYREAADSDSIQELGERYHKVLFCGFNALSTAEIRIFEKLFKSGKAEMLWDADVYYLNNKEQEAGHFLRNNLSIFPAKEIHFVGDHFKNSKEIEIVSVPKQMGQAQVVRQALKSLHSQGVSFDKVAVVLANEKLLWPVLQQIPPEVEHLNITMEYPLRFTASYNLVESLLQLHYNYSRQERKQKSVYHKDLSSLLRQPLLRQFLKIRQAKGSDAVLREITRRNLAYLNEKLLMEVFADDWHKVSGLLKQTTTSNLVNEIRSLLTALSESAADNRQDRSLLEKEHLSLLIKGLNRIQEVMLLYPHFDTIGALRQLFVQVSGSESVPFLGEPLTGLQVMGVLETRTLDFEHVILVNVNEGVLPSGKNANSFIPNDLKRAMGLPLYSDKDAVYAYHFYRLLQRAKTVTITYDSETDTFGKGEKSRFVTQLQLEMKRYNPGISITEKVAVSSDLLASPDHPIRIQKNQDVLRQIVQKATSAEAYGALSPSGLISFKQCGLRFYLRYGVLLKENDEVEENPEAGTFGSILHLSLENLYKDMIGHVVRPAELSERLTCAEQVTEDSFREVIGREDLAGKSILQLEVIKVYVKKLVKQDQQFVERLEQQSLNLEILYLEHEISASLNLPHGQPATVFIKGKIDRIDRHDGMVRIIDYKSSVKSTDKFEFAGFDVLFGEPAYDKQLQLLIYAWLLWKNKTATPEQIKPCIIPFKVFEDPKFLTAGRSPVVLTDQFLQDFEAQLALFVSRIFNSELPFSQTEDRKLCEYCAYNVVCSLQP